MVNTLVVAGDPFNIVGKRHLSSNQIGEHPNLQRPHWDMMSDPCFFLHAAFTADKHHIVMLHYADACSCSTVRHTRFSGQLNSSKTSWKSSMAPSVISMMAWLHRLPWPCAAACTHTHTHILCFYCEQHWKSSCCCCSSHNMTQTSLRILKDSFIAFFTLPSPLTCSPSTRSLKCCGDKRRQMNQWRAAAKPGTRTMWGLDHGCKIRTAEGEREIMREWVRRCKGGIIPGLLAHWPIMTKSLQHQEVIRINQHAQADSLTHT